ncbi:hypothetical protein ACLB2K_019550 [Fragaria x ananassa]
MGLFGSNSNSIWVSPKLGEVGFKDCDLCVFFYSNQWQTGQLFQPYKRSSAGGSVISLFVFTGRGGASQKCVRGYSQGSIAVYLSPNCPGLSHLMFADDTIFFTKATTSNCQVLRNILDSYCAASGQAINFDKSSVFFSANTADPKKSASATVLQIPFVSQPGVYLGLPTLWGNSKRSAMTFIREQIRQKIEGWKANILSQAGREVFIKSIAMVVPTYPMSIFLLPKTLCKAINSDLSNFW